MNASVQDRAKTHALKSLNSAGGSAFGMPFEFPNFWAAPVEFPKFAMPVGFQDLAQTTGAQVKTVCEKVKSANQSVGDGIREAHAKTTEALAVYSQQLIEAAQANMAASFDLAIKLVDAKSASDAVNLSTSYLHKQFETAVEQSNTFSRLAQKIASEAAEPLKEVFDGAVRRVA